MAARSETVKHEEADDMWNFCNASGVIALEDSSGSSSEGEWQQKRVWKPKRRKSQKVHVPEMITIDSTTDEEKDSDLDVELELKRKGVGAKKADSAFDDLKVIVTCQHVPRALTQAEQAATLRTQNTLLQLKRLQNQLASDASLPDEDGNDGEDEASDLEGSHSDGSESGDSPKDTEEKIILKIRWAQNQDPVKLRVGKGMEFQRLFDMFRSHGEQKNLFSASAALSFQFDGDVIQPDQTAEDLDLDDDCVIDVHW